MSESVERPIHTQIPLPSFMTDRGWKKRPVLCQRRGLCSSPPPGDGALSELGQGGGHEVRGEILAPEMFEHSLDEVVLAEPAVGVGEGDGALLDDVPQAHVGRGRHGRSRSCQTWSISASAVMAWAMVSRVMGAPLAYAGSYRLNVLVPRV
jgi:hypothetical protein